MVFDGFGFYIGFCIGVMIVKMIVYILDKDLIGVFSLKVIVVNCVGVNKMIVFMFDVWRKNVYVGVYCWKENRLEIVFEDVYIVVFDLFV